MYLFGSNNNNDNDENKSCCSSDAVENELIQAIDMSLSVAPNALDALRYDCVVDAAADAALAFVAVY